MGTRGANDLVRDRLLAFAGHGQVGSRQGCDESRCTRAIEMYVPIHSGEPDESHPSFFFLNSRAMWMHSKIKQNKVDAILEQGTKKNGRKEHEVALTAALQRRDGFLGGPCVGMALMQCSHKFPDSTASATKKVQVLADQAASKNKNADTPFHGSQSNCTSLKSKLRLFLFCF